MFGFEAGGVAGMPGSGMDAGWMRDPHGSFGAAPASAREIELQDTGGLPGLPPAPAHTSHDGFASSLRGDGLRTGSGLSSDSSRNLLGTDELSYDPFAPSRPIHRTHALYDDKSDASDDDKPAFGTMEDDEDDDSRTKGVVAAEVTRTAPGRFVRYVVRYPLIFMLLTAAPFVLISGWTLMTFGVNVDFSLDSFRIRDHPVAELADALHSSREKSHMWWTRLREDEGAGRYVLVTGKPGTSGPSRRASGSDGRALLEDSVYGSRGGDEGIDGSMDLRNLSAYHSYQGSTHRRDMLEDDESSDEPRRHMVRWSCHVIYHTVPDGRNVLTASAMNQARRLETSMQDSDAYHKFCWQGYDDSTLLPNDCQPANSIVPMFFALSESGRVGSRQFGDVVRVSTQLASEGLYGYTDKTFNPGEFIFTFVWAITMTDAVFLLQRLDSPPAFAQSSTLAPPLTGSATRRTGPAPSARSSWTLSRHSCTQSSRLRVHTARTRVTGRTDWVSPSAGM